MSVAAVRAISTPQSAKVSQKPWLTVLCFALVDAVAVALAALLALAGSSAPSGFVPGIFTLLAFAGLGLYRFTGMNPALEFQRVLVGSISGYTLTATSLFVIPGLKLTGAFGATSRYPAACAATVLLVLTGRSLCRRFCSHKSWWGTPAVLFGSGPEARAIFCALQRFGTGLKIVATFDSNPVYWPELDRSQVHVGTPQYAMEFAERCGISHAIVAMPDLTGEEIGKVVKTLSCSFRHLIVIPGMNGVSSVWAQPCAGGGMLGLHITHTLLQRGPRMLKRALDLLLIPMVAAAVLPILVITCVAVRVTSPGPILFGHMRIGRRHSIFKAWKFRTMHPNADQILCECLAKDPELRSQWERDHKLKNDPRVTFVGRFLRKTSLDEIPQLWNVLTGDMSFVGPRPIVAAEVCRYGDCFETYASVRPGITGLWQISGRNNTTYEERVQFDEYYVRNWSVWLDLYIMSRTFVTVLLREGAY